VAELLQWIIPIAGIAAVVYAIGMLAYRAGYLNIERLSNLMGMSF